MRIVDHPFAPVYGQWWLRCFYYLVSRLEPTSKLGLMDRDSTGDHSALLGQIEAWTGFSAQEDLAPIFERLQEAMARTEVNQRWQAEMAPLFVDLEGTPDSGLLLLEEVFHLVHGAGIQPILPAFHTEITNATNAAIATSGATARKTSTITGTTPNSRPVRNSFAAVSCP